MPSKMPSISPSKAPSDSPSAAPSKAPTSCEFVIFNSISGPNIKVSITYSQVDLDGGGTNVAFTIKVVGANLVGDIRGVFFHVRDWRTQVKNVTGTHVYGLKTGNNIIVNLGSGATMQGDESTGKHKLDVGVKIGTSGIGKGDDVRETKIIVGNISYADVIGEFGVRLTSVGTHGGHRLESSKLVGFGCKK